METRDIRLVFNYITRISKSYNLRPEITKSKGITINSIPSLLDQLKSREENSSDAEHLDYMKSSLSIYSLPLITVPDILEGKHKTSSSEMEIADDGNDGDEQTVTQTEDIEEPEEEIIQTEDIEEPEVIVEEEKKKKDKKKDKKNKKDKKKEEEEQQPEEKKERKSDKKKKDKKKDKSIKGIEKLEKMKEKLHKKK